MRGNRLVILGLTLLLVPGVAVAQGRGPDQDRRAELEQQFRHQFMAQVARRLNLTDEQRDRVRDVMADGMDARRDLALESEGLRIDLLQAVRDSTTEMSRFEEILGQLEDVRARELEIERREDAALAGVLDARQRAMFLMMRMQLNDRVRQMRGMRGPGAQGGPPRGPGDPGGAGVGGGMMGVGGPMNGGRGIF